MCRNSIQCDAGYRFSKLVQEYLRNADIAMSYKIMIHYYQRISHGTLDTDHSEPINNVIRVQIARNIL